MTRPWTPEQHKAAAEQHKAAAAASQNPSERGAHLGAARAHREAAQLAAKGIDTGNHRAHELSVDAEEASALRKRLGRILRESLRGPGRDRRSRR